MTLIITAHVLPEPEDRMHTVTDICTCEECGGTGKMTCWECNGSGSQLVTKTITADELAERQDIERQERLLLKRYGVRRVASIRDYWQEGTD
jgi:DnaJ-class molecular chaperone